MTPEQIVARRQAAQALAKAGVPTREIACALGCDESTVRRALAAAGMGRPVGRPKAGQSEAQTGTRQGLDPSPMSPNELRQTLAQLGISQAALAREIGVTKHAVENWASGRRPLQGPAAAAIRARLNMSLDACQG